MEVQLADKQSRMTPLDLQLSFVNKFNNEENASMETLDACEDPRAPPPLPYPNQYDRRPSAPPALLRIDGFMLRGRSHSPGKAEGRPGRELLRAKNMTQSMPNFHSTRSLHNRSVGLSLSKSSECEGGRGKSLLHTHALEFEQLLDDI
jgi:hypothetical protein